MSKYSMISKIGKTIYAFKGFLIFILLFLIVRSSVMDWNSVPSTSMNPTIFEGDRVLIDKLAFDVRFPFFHWIIAKRSQPKRGQVVVINSSVANKRLMKRVMAVPGDVIELKNNSVFLNNKELKSIKMERKNDEDGTSYKYIETIHDSSGNPVEYTVRKYIRQSDDSPFKNMKPVTIPEGYYFVMGDNRHLSEDSRRHLKLVPREEIIGLATHIVFSPEYDNYLMPRKDRWMLPL